MTHIPREQQMSLLAALKHCEDRLRNWTGESDANRRVLDTDPATALEAADFQLDQNTMIEFETVLRALARKLDLPLAGGVA